ncbi:MAG: efflux transporter outer membrane subunit, partial [Parachlamydiaceae bacterium]|nr:efflux transporter outer membrane subunit [Parachlamydiaceae bacterium]
DGLIGTVIPVKGKHVKRNVDFYELGFDAEWEIDLFGFTKHEIAALQAQSEAVQETLNGAWITLSAEIARNYIQLRGLQFQLETSLHLIELDNESLKLTNELSERGIINDSDLNHSLAQLNLLKAEIPSIQANITQTIYRLSVLLGKMPGELENCLSLYGHLPEIPKEISIGIPSELLRRRPDIVKAEREVAAATEKEGSAIAALFPRFSLRGFLGDIATKPGSLFSPSSATWLAGPQLLLPIFNSRLLEQDVEYSKRATQEALINYQKTVLEAIEESENTIVAFQQSEQKWLYLHEAQKNESHSLDYAYELYQKGSIDKFELIKAQKALLSTENLLMKNKIEQLNNYIALYKALGGSWGCSQSL